MPTDFTKLTDALRKIGGAVKTAAQDYGTPEGAKKAAETRKQGGTQCVYNSSGKPVREFGHTESVRERNVSSKGVRYQYPLTRRYGGYATLADSGRVNPHLPKPNLPK